MSYITILFNPRFHLKISLITKQFTIDFNLDYVMIHPVSSVICMNHIIYRFVDLSICIVRTDPVNTLYTYILIAYYWIVNC